ncbi:50S ribosomal protein L22 [Candidatus Dojkabacteria bacterium]|nr:50S ribosomal protein L22 [Candidatus Dojkabacteria bacterium]
MAKKEKKQENKMKFKVISKNLPISPFKLRLVADLVRGKEVVQAVNELKFLNKKGSDFILKAVKSGLANAENEQGILPEDLFIEEIYIDEATNKFMKRYKFVSRGRVARIIKRRSIINLVLSEK